MPYYNQPQFINNAVGSILNQTFKDFELIIVDDGSDVPLNIKAEFPDKRIRAFRSSHQGLVAARNFGNNEALAPIIVTQDSDDLSLPDRLEKIYKHMKDADVLLHSAYMNMWNPEHNCIYREYKRATPVNKEFIKLAQYLPGWPAYKKSLWEKKPFRYETQFAYDWMMHLDWIFSGAKYKILDEGLYEYVRHEGSISVQFEKDGRREESFKKIKEIMKNEYA